LSPLVGLVVSVGGLGWLGDWEVGRLGGWWRCAAANKSSPAGGDNKTFYNVTKATTRSRIRVAMCGQQCATKFIIVYGYGFDLIFMTSRVRGSDWVSVQRKQEAIYEPCQIQGRKNIKKFLLQRLEFSTC